MLYQEVYPPVEWGVEEMLLDYKEFYCGSQRFEAQYGKSMLIAAIRLGNVYNVFSKNSVEDIVYWLDQSECGLQSMEEFAKDNELELNHIQRAFSRPNHINFFFEIGVYFDRMTSNDPYLDDMFKSFARYFLYLSQKIGGSEMTASDAFIIDWMMKVVKTQFPTYKMEKDRLKMVAKMGKIVFLSMDNTPVLVLETSGHHPKVAIVAGHLIHAEILARRHSYMITFRPTEYHVFADNHKRAPNTQSETFKSICEEEITEPTPRKEWENIKNLYHPLVVSPELEVSDANGVFKAKVAGISHVDVMEKIHIANAEPSIVNSVEVPNEVVVVVEPIMSTIPAARPCLANTCVQQEICRVTEDNCHNAPEDLIHLYTPIHEKNAKLMIQKLVDVKDVLVSEDDDERKKYHDIPALHGKILGKWKHDAGLVKWDTETVDAALFRTMEELNDKYVHLCGSMQVDFQRLSPTEWLVFPRWNCAGGDQHIPTTNEHIYRISGPPGIHDAFLSLCTIVNKLYWNVGVINYLGLDEGEFIDPRGHRRTYVLYNNFGIMPGEYFADVKKAVPALFMTTYFRKSYIYYKGELYNILYNHDVVNGYEEYGGKLYGCHMRVTGESMDYKVRTFVPYDIVLPSHVVDLVGYYNRRMKYISRIEKHEDYFKEYYKLCFDDEFRLKSIYACIRRLEIIRYRMHNDHPHKHKKRKTKN